jgi:hypothetical protein
MDDDNMNKKIEAIDSDEIANVDKDDDPTTSTVPGSSKRARNHPIWNFFDVREKVYCKVQRCKSSFKLPPSTSVAKKHLQDMKKDKFHKAAFDEFSALCDEQEKSQKKPKVVDEQSVNQPKISSALKLTQKYSINSSRFYFYK